MTTPILATIKHRENQTCKTKLKTHLAFFGRARPRPGLTSKHKIYLRIRVVTIENIPTKKLF